MEIKPSLNFFEEQDKYINRYFTKEGYNTFYEYTMELIKIWYDKKTEYPLKHGMLVGLPYLKFANIINNKDELVGRIKGLAQLLCIKEATINLDNKTITINLYGE